MNAKRGISAKVWMWAVLPGLLAVASPAEAGHRFRVGHALRAGYKVTRRVLTRGYAHHRVWVEPVYTIRRRVIEVPAVYETRERPVWHEPVYEYRRVAVGPGYRRGGFGFEAGRRSHDGGFGVEVALGGRRGYRIEKVLIREGYWETVYEEVLVRRATTRVIEERVLVAAGYWRDGYYDGRVIPFRGGYGHRHHHHHGFRASIGGGGVRVSYRR